MNTSSLEAQMRALEDTLLGHTSAETLRPLESYVQLCGYPSLAALLEDISQAGLVCDLGSGLGGLTKICFLEGITTPIIPVNPVAMLPVFGDAMRILETLGYTEEQIQEATDYHDSLLEIAYAHNLPFADNTFGLLFDCMAVTDCMDITGYPDVYRQSIREMIRVVRPGGRAILASPDVFTKLEPMDGERKGAEEIISEVVAEMGCRYEMQWGSVSDGVAPRPLAVIITKGPFIE